MTNAHRPPDFGPDGARPPARSEPFERESSFFLMRPVDGHEAGRRARQLLNEEDVTDADLVAAKKWGREDVIGLANPIVELPRPSLRGADERGDAVVDLSMRVLGALLPEKRRQWQASRTSRAITSQFCELRRVLHEVRWVRRDDIGYVAPGVQSEFTTRTTIGVSRTSIRELSGAFGAKGEVAGLNALIQARFSQSVTVTQQRESSYSVRIGHRDDHHRYFAVWFREHTISVEKLRATSRPAPAGSSGFVWWTVGSATFLDDAEPTPTVLDVPM